ncbi:hypothetical protein, partial [Klebsiella aerogenes]|uniref:hypothetical protein n=1 Tax=Klebsiella aerogenes TaxID=548 RepID=UPI001953EF5F
RDYLVPRAFVRAAPRNDLSLTPDARLRGDAAARGIAQLLARPIVQSTPAYSISAREKLVPGSLLTEMLSRFGKPVQKTQ